jgi:Bacterial archaeo-eukaryotic release factor family 7
MTTLVHPSVADLLQELAAEHDGPCLSLYLAHPQGWDLRQMELRSRQLLAQAEADLAAAGAEATQVKRLLAPARALLAGPWQEGDANALALFASTGFFRKVAGDFPVHEKAVVGARFLRPLLPLLADPDHFYVLALSLERIRLLEATPHGQQRISLGDWDRSFVEAMGYQQFYAGLQTHSAGGSGGVPGRPATLHGHGDRDEEKLEEDLRHWCRRIADAIAARVADRHALRVLATTREHVPLYAKASGDPRLLPEAVEGNPDHLTDAEVVALARPLVRAALAEER